MHEAQMRVVFLALAVILMGAAGAALASDDRGPALDWPVMASVHSCPGSYIGDHIARPTGMKAAKLGAERYDSLSVKINRTSDAPGGAVRHTTRRRGAARIRFRPSVAIARKLVGRPVPDVVASAKEQWDIAAESRQAVLPGIHLPGQIERIKATEFATLDHVVRILKGGFEIEQRPTRAYRIMDVDLVDGVLYGPGSQRHLRPGHARSPAYRAPLEAVSGAMYESWTGNRWFGCWLAEDCLSYPLAEAYGKPIATPPDGNWGHRAAYNARLGIAPQYLDSVHFDELIVFDDTSSNPARVKRARDMREKLLRDLEVPPVPGAFLLRGRTGDLRLMANESEIAQRLATEYGFLILDPATATLDEIAAVCSQARVVAGVEGSHLVHGAVVMPFDATLFVIQPPTRATVFLKAMTDLRGQRFAFVVAEGGVDGFTCDWEEIRRTLDMALAA